MIFTGGSENVIIHEWGGDGGWAAIEFKPVDFKDVAAASQLVALFENFNVVAVDCQPAGCRKPPKPTPDHDDFLFRRALPVITRKTIYPELTLL